MSGELAQILAVVVRLEAKVDRMHEKPRPSLTQVEFAKAANISPRTVKRKIDAGIIQTRKGRIPHSELTKWVS